MLLKIITSLFHILYCESYDLYNVLDKGYVKINISLFLHKTYDVCID